MLRAIAKDPSTSVKMLHIGNSSIHCVLLHCQEWLWLCSGTSIVSLASVSVWLLKAASKKLLLFVQIYSQTWSHTEWVQGKRQSHMLCLYQSFTTGWDVYSVGSMSREVVFLHNFPGQWVYAISWSNKSSDTPLNLLHPFQDGSFYQGLRMWYTHRGSWYAKNLLVSNSNSIWNLKKKKKKSLCTTIKVFCSFITTPKHRARLHFLSLCFAH